MGFVKSSSLNDVVEPVVEFVDKTVRVPVFFSVFRIRIFRYFVSSYTLPRSVSYVVKLIAKINEVHTLARIRSSESTSKM